MEGHELDDSTWECSCGEECWTPEAFDLHLVEVAEEAAARPASGQEDGS